MINFGFTISKDSQIDYDKLDRKLSKAVQKLEPTFNQCIGCGTCSATCSAAEFTDFNFRKLTLMIKRGLVDEVGTQISKCLLCAKCKMLCPRGVNTRNVVVSIRKAINTKSI